jgi:hypothetical protein
LITTSTSQLPHKDRLALESLFPLIQQTTIYFMITSNICSNQPTGNAYRQQMENPELDDERRQYFFDQLQQAEQSVISKQDQYIQDFPMDYSAGF